jgi:hypothetical protein
LFTVPLSHICIVFMLYFCSFAGLIIDTFLLSQSVNKCIFYYYYYYYYVISYHRPFLLGTSLEPTVIPTAQASSSRPAVLSLWCEMFQAHLLLFSESTECFPYMASKFCFKTSVIIPVAPIIIPVIIIKSTIMHFMFHVSCTRCGRKVMRLIFF